MKFIFSALFGLMAAMSSFAQWQTGDIAFTSYFSDAPDRFSFISFRTILLGDSLGFTDLGWDDGEWNTTSAEGELKLSFNQEIAAGTEIFVSDDNGTWVCIEASIIELGSFSLHASGDQVLAFDLNNRPSVGNDSGFIAGINMNGDWDASSSTFTTSTLPSSLANSSAIAFQNEVDNAMYSCALTTGTIQELRTSLTDTTAWLKSNEANISILIPCSWTILPGCELTLEIESTTFPDCSVPTGGNIQVQAQNGLAPYSFIWSNGLEEINLNGFSEQDDLSEGDYIIGVTDDSGCSAYDTIVLTGQNKVANIHALDLSVCFENTIQLQTLPVQEYQSSWNLISGDGTLVQNDSVSFTLNPNSAGPFLVEFILSHEFCTIKDTIQVTVDICNGLYSLQSAKYSATLLRMGNEIQYSHPAEIKVFDLNGKLCSHSTSSLTSETKSLRPGIYTIVRGDKTHKVLIQ